MKKNFMSGLCFADKRYGAGALRVRLLGGIVVDRTAPTQWAAPTQWVGGMKGQVMKVLLYDPDWRFTRTATTYLESKAHNVVCETHAVQVAARVKNWRPDLVIVAAEVAEKSLMDSLHSSPHRPAVLLTCWMERFDLAWRAWQMGADELLMKPVIKTAEFTDAIVTALKNAAGAVETPIAVSA